MAGVDPIWRGTSVCAAIDRRCERYGAEKARREATLRQKQARRARSRKQFEFWAAVAAEIGRRAETPGS
jgi:hypothetical protein